MIKQGRILMARHYDLYIGEEYWCLPGGAVEAGELPEQAAVREVKEETDLDIRLIRRLREERFPGVSQGYAASVTFLAEVTGGRLKLGMDPEQADWDVKFLQAVRWVPLDAGLLWDLHRFFMRDR